MRISPKSARFSDGKPKFVHSGNNSPEGSCSSTRSAAGRIRHASVTACPSGTPWPKAGRTPRSRAPAADRLLFNEVSLVRTRVIGPFSQARRYVGQADLSAVLEHRFEKTNSPSQKIVIYSSKLRHFAFLGTSCEFRLWRAVAKGRKKFLETQALRHQGAFLSIRYRALSSRAFGTGRQRQTLEPKRVFRL